MSGGGRAGPRRLLTVIESLGRGGAERLLVTTHAHLDRTRFTPAVAALWPPYDLADELARMDVPVYRLDTAGPRDLVRAVTRLRGVVRRVRPDLVHTHLFAANVAGRLATPRPTPVVTSLHNPDYTFEDNGTLRFRARKALDRWTGLRRNELFIAVSDAVRADYALHMGFRPVQVLPNYLDVDGLRARCGAVDRERQRVRLGIGEQEVLVLHVGRFHRQKGQDVLLRAFAEARREAPHLRLALAGEGAELPDMRGLAEELGLEDGALFLGGVADPAPLYAAADVFAFPSRWEAFGVALLEAMAAGLPVVASRTGGILEIVDAGSGVLVPVEQATPLAAALVELSRDPGLRERLGAAAAVRARAFDAAASVRRLEALYEHV